jgi:hypothetical protein
MKPFGYWAPMQSNHFAWLVFKDVDGSAVLIGKTPTLWKAEELMEALGPDSWAERIEKEERRAA